MSASATRDVNGNTVEIWTRRTLADGDNMYNGCIKPICDAIEDAGSDISGMRESIDFVSGALDDEVYRATSADSALSASISAEVNRAKNVEGELSTAISAETTARIDADQNLQKQIDTLKAATDVIAVFGTYPEFTAASAGSWQEQVTDNDFIKVLRDSAYNPTGDDDANTSDDDYYQVYYQWHSSAHDGWNGWSAIGNLDPYYSVAEIDDKETELSSTIANTYLSANGTDISAGKNLYVFIQSNNPRVAFKTKDNVTFVGVSSTTLSAATAYGSSAKFDNISASGISSNSAIINTISGHSAHFDDIDISAIDLDNITAENIISKNISATSSLSGLDLTISNSAKIVGISSTNVSSTNISALSLTANTASGQSANFDDISGKNISANIISGTNVTGDKLTVNTSAKIVGIYATNVSSTNITANSFTGNNAEFTDISATNNISANSATIVNVSAKNLTAEFGRIPSFSTDEITADSSISSNTISAVNITGTNAYITNITADSGYFTDIGGETLHGVTSSIDVDELISAVSSMSGESNLYVRKDELECEIGTDNSATIQSFAQGKSNRANENSFVQGNLNSANDDSFAQGYCNSAYRRSFAQGYSNTAYYESLAQGNSNRVSYYSMGQGVTNSATNYSIAQGYHNDASNTAQAFGSNLVIESAMAIGKFNKTSSDAVFVIGNGTADNARNDLMVVDNLANITLNREEANDIYSVIINPNILSGSYSSNRGGTISTGNYQSDWISICRNASGDYVPKTANQCSIGEANNTALGNYVLVQGESNLAYDYSFAQGISNTAKSNSIAQGSGNSAEKNAQAFGEQAYASAGIAINPHYWGSTTPTMAINNSFAMGKECVATADSLAFGQNNTATVWGMAFGQNNTASNFSVAFGLGISADNNQYIYGKYPSVGNNTVFAIGNGTADNDRSNYVSINKYGTLNLKNVVSAANKSVIINGHDGYIRSEEKYRNIPMLLTSGYALTSTITGSLLSTPTINAETLLLYGNDSDYLNMWVPTGTSGNKFKIMKVASSGTYKISIGIQAGYDMIFKNFSSGTTLASRKKIQTDNTGTSWPTPQQGTNISTSAKSFYFSAESNTTCVQFTEIPGHDDIDVIVDSFGKHFIMIKNHSDVEH